LEQKQKSSGSDESCRISGGIAVETAVAFGKGASVVRHYSNCNNEQNVMKATINHGYNVCKNSHGMPFQEM